jgi:hypothetical protein
MSPDDLAALDKAAQPIEKRALELLDAAGYGRLEAVAVHATDVFDQASRVLAEARQAAGDTWDASDPRDRAVRACYALLSVTLARGHAEGDSLSDCLRHLADARRWASVDLEDAQIRRRQKAGRGKGTSEATRTRREHARSRHQDVRAEAARMRATSPDKCPDSEIADKLYRRGFRPTTGASQSQITLVPPGPSSPDH